MSYLGSWKVDDLLTFYVNTHRFDTGVGTDADSVPTYRVYEDETGTPLLTGSMALIDSSNTAGFYSEQITLSAANGFEKGKCYSIYITATVNSVAATTSKTFQMEAEVDANTVSPTVVNCNVTQISGDGAAADNAESFFDGNGYAGTGNVIPSVTTVTGNVNGNVGGNVTGSVGSVAAGGITASSIATDAIDADALAADAVTEIQSGLATAAALATVDTVVDSILADTGTDGVIVATNNDKTGYSLAAGQLFIKKNVAFANFCFVMTDDSMHAPATGLTVSGSVSLDGGSFSALGGSVSEVANGLYKVNLAQAETNAVTITLRFTATGADTRMISIVTQA